MLSADDVVKFGFGVLIGGSIMHFWTWSLARKIAALVPGGLKVWDRYDLAKDTLNPLAVNDVTINQASPAIPQDAPQSSI